MDVGARPVAVDPATHDRLVAVFSHLPHVLANVLASQAAGRLADHGEALRQVGPELPRHDARGGREHRHLDRHLPRQPRRDRRGDRRLPRRELERVEELLAEPATVAAWNDRAREDRRALLESDAAAGPVHELRLTVPNRPGIVAQVALELGKAGVNIVDLALAPAVRHALGRHDALDRQRRPGGARGRADRRARLPRRRAVSSARFDPTGPLRGDYLPPADKSISHRAALFAAMADEPVTVRNYLESQDTRSTLDALLKLGAAVEEDGPGAMLIRGVGLHAPLEATGGLLDVGNSGTLMRLLPGWLAGQPGGELDARRRRVDPAPPGGPDRRAAGRRWAPRSSRRDGRFPPFTVRGAELTGIDLRAARAERAGQVVRADRRACSPRAPPRSSRAPRAATTRSGCCAGRACRSSGTGCARPSRQVDELELDEIVVPADPSSAAFIVAAATLVAGSRVVVKDVGLNWTRTGFFRIAERMGAVILGDLEEPGTETDAGAGRRAGRGVEPARGHRRRAATRCRSRSTS